MIEPHLDQRRQGRVGRQVPADVRVILIRAHHHGQSVPAHHTLDAPLNGAVTGIRDLFLDGDGIDVGSIPTQRNAHAQVRGALHQVFEQVAGPVGPRLVDNFVERLNPFGGFLGIEVVGRLYS